MNIEKIIIYTALFDDYDKLSSPVIKNKNIKYICFTNNSNLQSKDWEIIIINESGNGRFLNRKVKMLPHLYLKNYDKSIYIDSNVLLIYDPLKLYSYLLDYNFVLFEHPNKNTFLDEIKVNYRNKNINQKIYSELLVKHSNYIFFDKTSIESISVNRILVRNHNNEKIIKLMENWWNDYTRLKINRDQLILPYLLKKHNLKVKIIKPKNNYSNYYLLKAHKHYPLILKFKFFVRFSIIEIFLRIVFKFKKNNL